MENDKLFLLLSANNSNLNNPTQKMMNQYQPSKPQAKNSGKFSYGTGATKDNSNNKGMYRY